jgi:hypothetical protein
LTFQGIHNFFIPHIPCWHIHVDAGPHLPKRSLGKDFKEFVRVVARRGFQIPYIFFKKNPTNYYPGIEIAIYYRYQVKKMSLIKRMIKKGVTNETFTFISS